MTAIQPKVLFAFFVLVFAFAFRGGAQSPTPAELQLKKAILDAEAVQNSARGFEILEDEYNALNWFLDSLTTLLGYQRNSLPIALRPVSPQLRDNVDGVVEQLGVHSQLCRRLLKDYPEGRTPDKFADAWTVLSPHPGCYYNGLSLDPLCNHPLAKEINLLELQDYPFAEAAEGDPCLWELAKNAPNLSQIVAFGCAIDDATLTEMHLEQLMGLAVLALDENELTEVPLTLFKTGKLRSLSLSRNQISHLPADLNPLNGLVYLELYGNPIGEEEQARIKKGLPNTMVMFKR